MWRWGWILLALTLTACGGTSSTPSTTATAFASSFVPTIGSAPLASATPDPSKGTLTAMPNPVPGGPGNGTTTIRWIAPPGMSVQIWVSAGGGAETLFTEGSEGSQNAPWIQTGQTYRFSMYAGSAHTAPALQTVTVTR